VLEAPAVPSAEPQPADSRPGVAAPSPDASLLQLVDAWIAADANAKLSSRAGRGVRQEACFRGGRDRTATPGFVR